MYKVIEVRVGDRWPKAGWVGASREACEENLPAIRSFYPNLARYHRDYPISPGVADRNCWIVVWDDGPQENEFGPICP